MINLQVDTCCLPPIARGMAAGAIAVSCNYLANVPEIVDLSKETKASRLTASSSSASFTAESILAHGGCTIDCMPKRESCRVIDDRTEEFVKATRMCAGA